MSEELEPRVFINRVGQLVIPGQPSGDRDVAFIALEDWAEIRRQADAAIRDYAEKLVRECLP